MPTLDPHNTTEHNAHQPNWRKSNRSLSAGECVETAYLTDTIGIRDSKDTTGPVLTLTPTHWQTLLTQIKKGHHDLP